MKRKTKTPEPQQGEVWFVKISGASCVSEMKVASRTRLTVELKENQDFWALVNRYKLDDVEFVERKP